jgi:hypothetical protein
MVMMKAAATSGSSLREHANFARLQDARRNGESHGGDEVNEEVLKEQILKRF